MIRRHDAAGLLLIAQHDHALLAGQLARHVGRPPFPRPEPFDPFVHAVAHHDAGWPAHDDRPARNARGEPIDVFESTPDIALRVWPGAAEQAASFHPYAGLLVSLHVLSLSRMAMAPPGFEHETFPKTPRVIFEVNKFQHHQVELQHDLRRRLGLATDIPLDHGLSERSADPREQQLVYHFRLLQALDQISLAACCTKPPMDQTTPLPAGPAGQPVQLSLRRHGNDVLVHPWPFLPGSIPCHLPARQLPATSYDTDDALQHALASAPRIELPITIRPA